MFHLLDETLSELIKAVPDTLAELHGASVSFLTPDKTYSTQSNPPPSEINLFLYEVKENRELRNAAPNFVQRDNMSTKQRSPLRVDCTYMVTAWCTDAAHAHDKTKDSHKLLGQAFNWLSRFPVIPDKFLQAVNFNDQIYSPPTMVAQMDGAKSAGEFWSALGTPPRPYFNIVVTICMDLEQQIEDHVVTTVSSTYSAGSGQNNDERLVIGGTVRNNSGDSLANVWVRIEELNLVQVTDSNGQFVFKNVAPFGGLKLVARANGLGEISRTIDIPSVTSDYDLTF